MKATKQETDAVKAEETITAAKAAETAPVYTAVEFVGAAKKIFGVSPDIASAALRVAGVKTATVAEAEEIIKKFANKEVK